MYKFYNANPFGRNVNDCTVRAISLATENSWSDTYDWLSSYAKSRGITFSEMECINDFLAERFKKFELPHNVYCLQDFLDLKLRGRWLVTMPNHITCVVDGVCYDTFDPSGKFIWNCYRVK